MKIFQNKMSTLRNVLVGTTMVVATSSAFAHVKLESATPAINEKSCSISELPFENNFLASFCNTLKR